MYSNGQCNQLVQGHCFLQYKFYFDFTKLSHVGESHVISIMCN